LNITDIRVRRTYQDTRLKALVSVTIDNDLAVHDIKVICGPERLFVAMPSRKDDSGDFRDICHPITPEARATLETAILRAYDEYLQKAAVAERQESINANAASESSLSGIVS
jgi:stage V sporulation protein G